MRSFEAKAGPTFWTVTALWVKTKKWIQQELGLMEVPLS
jgi:hypothetical protein